MNTALRVAEDITELMGSTPMLRLRRVTQGAEVYAKLEFLNPGGSVKDRAALGMILEAEKQGRLRPGSTIVEATAGNTGVGLALVGVNRGYKVTLFVPEGFAEEKCILMRGFGATVVRTPEDEGMAGAIRRAIAMVKEDPEIFAALQFENQANPQFHHDTTALEIWEQMEGRVDAFVAGVGTGGTFSGVARFLKEKDPATLTVAVETQGSVLQGGVPGPHKVEGIGVSFVPKTFDREVADEIVMVNDDDAFVMVRRLAAEEGVLAGSSSGAIVHAAAAIAQRLGPGKRIATIIPDSAERYLSKNILEGLVGSPLSQRSGLNDRSDLNKSTASPRAPSMTDSTLTRSPEPSTCLFTSPPPTRRRRSASTRVTSIPASPTPHATRSKRTWPHSKEAPARMCLAAAWQPSPRWSPCCKTGDHVICGANVYGGTQRLFDQIVTRYGIEFSYVDTSDPENVRQAIRPTTKLAHIETPTNPLMTLTDIRAVADICHESGVELAVDNTFMSPYFQRPIELGADIVMHSTTKFLNGHSDGLGGVLVGTKPEHKEKFAFVQKCTGGILSPFECWMVLRGVKTLAVRMKQHDESGRRIAAFLAEHKKVEQGLLSWPAHASAARVGEAADVRLRSRHLLRDRLARQCQRHVETREGLHAWRIARRSRNPHLPPRHHDPRSYRRGSPHKTRYHRWTRAHFSGNRRCRRPDQRPRSGIERNLTTSRKPKGASKTRTPDLSDR